MDYSYCILHFSWYTFFVCLINIMQLALTVNGGSCWQTLSSGSRCQNLLSANKTREECCSREGPLAYWSPRDDGGAGELFYYQFMVGGAPECSICNPSTTRDPCTGVTCGENKKCKVRRGQPRCVCAPDCSNRSTRHRGPLCGGDGQTYRNHCALLKDNCRFQLNVWIDYAGACQRSCDTVTCGDGEHCVHDQNGLPHCTTCPTCSDVSSTAAQVCGTNGVTYPSRCHVGRAACMNGEELSIAYTGICNPLSTCADIHCTVGLHTCLTSPVTSQPQCHMCRRSDYCSQYVDSGKTVCGTDGQTYTSWCDLQQTACETGSVITTAHSGPCGGKNSIRCYPDQDTSLCMTPRIPEESCTVRYPGEMSVIPVCHLVLQY